jgi:hypothetical protein
MSLEGISYSNPTRILEGEGCRILKTDAPPAPSLQALNQYKRLKQGDKQFIERFVQQAHDYLESPTILDNFGPNHNERRQWRRFILDKYGPEVREYLGQNKLRANTITMFVMSFEMCIDILNRAKIRSPEANRLRELYAQIPQADLMQYSNLSRVGKMRVVRKLEDVCRGVLNAFPSMN